MHIGPSRHRKTKVEMSEIEVMMKADGTPPLPGGGGPRREQKGDERPTYIILCIRTRRDHRGAEAQWGASPRP